jgi:hypothetical protein
MAPNPALAGGFGRFHALCLTNNSIESDCYCDSDSTPLRKELSKVQ